jgi:hypothetical protein
VRLAFLALAVGTDPSDPGLMALAEGHTGIFELKTESTNDQRGTMTVTNQNGSLFASLSLQALKVSWRAAYAVVVNHDLCLWSEQNLVHCPTS